MDRSLFGRLQSFRRRLRRLERREADEFRHWIENTRNLIHLTVVVLVPLLIALVTWLSNAVTIVSFLIFPPLASGAYTLFSEPEGRYSDPYRFIGGLTAGAVCGWLSLEVTSRYWYHVPPEQFHIHAGAAALSVALTGLVTWGIDVELPSAFSTALLILFTGTNQLTYVLGIAISSTIVAGAFVFWRRSFYQKRAQYLYETTRGDDHVLVPIRGRDNEEAAFFGAEIADAHDAGKVVLFRMLTQDDLTEANTASHLASDGGEISGIPQDILDHLEGLKTELEDSMDVPCETVIALAESESFVATTIDAANEVNCDLIVCPYETNGDRLSGYVRGLFRGPIDTVVFRPSNGRSSWSKVLVLTRRQGDVANAMLDFALRIAPFDGNVSVCTCIGSGEDRRRVESMLADLVDPFSRAVETRVSESPVEYFIDANGSNYDLTFMGASTDRSAASRLISAPTFERLQDVECDLAIVHRGKDTQKW